MSEEEDDSSCVLEEGLASSSEEVEGTLGEDEEISFSSSELETSDELSSLSEADSSFKS